MNTRLPIQRKAGIGAVTLVELMMASAITGLMVVLLASLYLFGSRSFAAMANYRDLDSKSRHALDIMSLEMRQVTRVLAFESTGSNRWLLLTNDSTGSGVRYSWSAGSRTLSAQKTGEATPATLLTECDDWQFQLYQRTPRRSSTNLFFPATNSFGAYDTRIIKLIDMSWKCSRTILGEKVNTESVQTAQIVLRNKP